MSWIIKLYESNRSEKPVEAFINRNIYLLHAFKKQTQKTPRQEIQTALKRFQSLT